MPVPVVTPLWVPESWAVPTAGREDTLMRRRRLNAFTLIELLVVIALITILAAILFPVIAQVREKGHQAACLSNLRQISAAMLIYADDNDEQFPPAVTREGDEPVAFPMTW